MITSVFLHNDRSHKSQLPKEISTFMCKHTLISSRDDCVSFCGFLINETDLYLFVPRNVDTTKIDTLEKKISYAILLMKTVEQYSQAHTTGVYDSSTQVGEVNVGILSLAKELLEDYILNGLYIHKVTKQNQSSGRINWKETISKGHPLIGKGGVPVYLDLHSSITRYQTNSPVAAIQAEIIKELDEQFSWWITGKADAKLSLDLNDHQSLTCTTEEKKKLITDELRYTYSDREIRLLKNLIQYLDSPKGMLDGYIVSGIQKFHFAWEGMLRKTLPHVVNLNNKLPVPAYVIEQGKHESVRGMVTDIIISYENITIIVDAKYYHAKSTSSAPGWSDLVKQFFYAKAVQCIRPDHTVKNLFIFPSEKNEYDNGPLRQAQMISPTSKETFDDVFCPVDCYYISPTMVMKAYTERRKLPGLQQLFQT